MSQSNRVCHRQVFSVCFLRKLLETAQSILKFMCPINFRISNFVRCLFLSLLAGTVLCSCSKEAPAPKIKVMLLTGQSSKYHNWELSSLLLEKRLSALELFEVTKVVSPAQGEDFFGFNPEFASYDVVVLDYEGDSWPDSARKRLEAFVGGGGGCRKTGSLSSIVCSFSITCSKSLLFSSSDRKSTRLNSSHT